MSSEFATIRLSGGLLPLRSGRSRRRPTPMTTTTTTTLAVVNKKPAATSARCSSSRRDDAEFSFNGSDDGRLVDEGMAVLRRRIHELEAAELGWEPEPRPQGQEWAAWEKEWYAYYATCYDADVVCQLLGVLQAFLVNSRPGVGVAFVAVVGLVAVLVLAVPASAFVLVKLLLDASRAIISNLHTADDDD